jgi:RNA polymerase sigma-70 factor (ECF subfamily)
LAESLPETQLCRRASGFGRIGDQLIVDERHDLDPEGWVDRHGDVMFRYALRWLRSSQIAEEIVQESFLEALRTRATYQARSSERTWLVGILRHKLLDHDRRSRREHRRETADVIDDSLLGRYFDRRGRWKATPARWKGTPSSELERREFWSALDRCLALLSPLLADAFVLRELDGLESDAVCEVLQISTASLWQRLHRSRMFLRDCLLRQGFGEATSLPGKGQPCAGCLASGNF